MRIATIALFSCLNFFALPALAAERPVSEASVKRLLEVTNARKMLDGMMSQMDAMMKSSIKQAVPGQTFTPEQEMIMEETQGKVVSAMWDELKWEALEPMYIEVYQKIFTQPEVDGMLAFYKTKSGQAVIRKMPLVMQTTTQMMQSRMAPLIPKIQQIIMEGTTKMLLVSPPVE
ncbi:MAG: DUF2059 domain-containing protein [Pseudomonadota bacterium]